MAAQNLQSKKQSPLVKAYLLTYNGIETFGWALILFRLLSYYIFSNSEAASLYQNLKWPLIIFQNAAVLEILHAAVRIVPSNPIVTLQQVFSRVMLVCGIFLPTLAGQTSIGLPLAVLAWSITEIIRYGYYTLNLVHLVPHFLIWLRYTAFIILYPIGVTGELLCLYAGQQEVSETGLWTISLPNFLNFSFQYRHFILMVMSLYIPLFPQLYMHMFTQRKKVLGGGTKKEEKKQ
ncbi:hypothetical protein ILUMI_24322 [Ignelater luminosus]|uniref:Very-long-chain (3R)-3-hydroxyacyl-CoA dehydratase n=1 Tax=Ignelater luminosus TaxID=2038154 RepID=A0A8K0C796_IGNLU|nr:hypothetical protein ILUMI_24322 [Ignelater luminosus]